MNIKTIKRNIDLYKFRSLYGWSHAEILLDLLFRLTRRIIYGGLFFERLLINLMIKRFTKLWLSVPPPPPIKQSMVFSGKPF
jgi:hypothetical protein